jgi:hypothetical protein
MEPIGTKALTEKLPGLLPFPVVMRVVLPGALLLSSLAPIMWPRLTTSEVWQHAGWGSRTAAGAVLIMLLGIILSLLDRRIYQFYEGIFLWPRSCFLLAKKLQQRSVSERFREASDLEVKDDIYSKLRYDKLWYWLRMFPTDEAGDPQAQFPTTLGNILASYEDYPSRRYGMDATFYWTRLWLALEEDKRKVVDTQWSIADGVLYCSFALLFSSFIYITFGVTKLATHVIIKSWGHLATAIDPLVPRWDFLLGTLALTLAYLVYRLSLPYHRQNGESFKALFDLYRDKLSLMQRIGEDEITRWKTAWAYLQYLSVLCECGESYEISSGTCPDCGTTTQDNLKRIRADVGGSVVNGNEG